MLDTHSGVTKKKKKNQKKEKTKKEEKKNLQIKRKTFIQLTQVRVSVSD